MPEETKKKKKKKTALKSAKHWRLFFMFLFCIIDFILPVIFIGVKYKLFTKFNGVKLTVISLLLILLITWRFRAKLKEWINKWEYSIWKYILLGFSKIFIFILVWVVAILVEHNIGDLAFCFGWITICSSVAYLIINPLIERFDFIVKRELRKAETKEALKEFKALEEEES